MTGWPEHICQNATLDRYLGAVFTNTRPRCNLVVAIADTRTKSCFVACYPAPQPV
jgi:hypothetical protein